MKPPSDRRHFLKAAAAVPWLAVGSARPSQGAAAQADDEAHLKISCNLYSFNRLLESGTMSLEEVIAFCSDLGFAAVDPTGYYFPDYPHVPTREYLNHIKRYAFVRGLDISGTGVRNDFTLADEQARQAEVRRVKRWMEAAAWMGAPALRVFAGGELAEGRSRAKATDLLVESLRECAAYGGQYGVMTALQNHAEFLKTADQVEEVVRRVDSDWLGLNLDIGSLDEGDPYAEIAALAPYAVTWQIKEVVRVKGEKVDTNLDKIVDILRDVGYRGYIPVETLGPGDPREKVPRFLSEVRAALRRSK